MMTWSAGTLVTGVVWKLDRHGLVPAVPSATHVTSVTHVTPGQRTCAPTLPTPWYSTYLAGDADRIKANLAEAASGGYKAQFGEYMVQYLALADPAAAREQLTTCPPRSTTAPRSPT